MHLFKTAKGIALQRDDSFQFVDAEWDSLISDDDLYGHLSSLAHDASEAAREAVAGDLLPPIGTEPLPFPSKPLPLALI